MKKTRRIAAMLAAMALAATMVAPTMMNASAADTSSITITSDSSVSHTYEIYQVMKGKYTAGTNGNPDTFTELKWGADVTAYNSAAVTPGNDVSDADLTAISGMADAGTLPTNLTLTTGTRKYSNQSGAGDITFDGLEEGYYIVKDVTDLTNADDANSAWIVQVAGTTSIAVKSAKPTVDKKVLDETGDAEAGHTNGWGESADHAINESFQFKLIATIPADADLKEYGTYALKFNDTMSSGVTFDSIESVKISSAATLTGDDAKILTNSQYSKTEPATVSGTTNQAWTLDIADVKAIVNDNDGTAGINEDDTVVFGNEVITVEVIYNAHLNENAIVDTASRTGGTTSNTNNNSVFLNYSNNPDSTGAGTTQPGGKTETDYVWVFTYEVDNTKYKINDTAGNELEGAVFELYSGNDSSVTANKINLAYDTTNKVYYPAGANDATATLTSSSDNSNKGQFNIIGLDAGTYVLKEVTPPTGYNAVSDITFTITATHAEDSGDPSKVDLSLTGIGNGVENKPVDTKNSTLPSTGGMGTKLFIAGGGITATLAAVYLVSKKRSKED